MQQRRRENAAWTTKVDVSGCSYVVTIWENVSLCLTKCIWRLIDFNLFECESLSNSGSVEGQTPSFAFHLRATGSKAIYCLSLFYHKLISQLFMPRLPSVSKWSHKKNKIKKLNNITVFKLTSFRPSAENPSQTPPVGWSKRKLTTRFCIMDDAVSSFEF